MEYIHLPNCPNIVSIKIIRAFNDNESKIKIYKIQKSLTECAQDCHLDLFSTYSDNYLVLIIREIKKNRYQPFSALLLSFSARHLRPRLCVTFSQLSLLASIYVCLLTYVFPLNRVWQSFTSQTQYLHTVLKANFYGTWLAVATRPRARSIDSAACAHSLYYSDFMFIHKLLEFHKKLRKARSMHKPRVLYSVGLLMN